MAKQSELNVALRIREIEKRIAQLREAEKEALHALGVVRGRLAEREMELSELVRAEQPNGELAARAEGLEEAR